MSRLGRCADKLEYVISKEDYQFFVKRIVIENQLEEGNTTELEKLLVEYELLLKEEDMIHFQYINMIRAFLTRNEGRDNLESIRYLEKAMSYTMSF